MSAYSHGIFVSIFIKFLASVAELAIPYILAHLIDDVVPLQRIGLVLLWGGLMIATSFAARQLNISANSRAVDNAHRVSYDVRQALFSKTANLSGAQFDAFGLPSLISRVTSDSYNVQACVQSLQTMCTRMPILLFGGIAATMLMDPALSAILCVIVPILLAVVLTVSRYGIPLYRRVQERLDGVVRTMREDITGIRVVKALSKTEYEKRRFRAANDSMTRADILASTVMAVPGPFMQMCLNIGLTLAVWFGAQRVYGGAIKPGVILAFLTYFNMVMQGVMGINRIFMMLSKATASADRIDQVLSVCSDQEVCCPHLRVPSPPETNSSALSTWISATERPTPRVRLPERSAKNACPTSALPSVAARASASSGRRAAGKPPSSIFSCAFTTPGADTFSWTAATCAATKRTSCAASSASCSRTTWSFSTRCAKTSASDGASTTSP